MPSRLVMYTSMKQSCCKRCQTRHIRTMDSPCSRPIKALDPESSGWSTCLRLPVFYWKKQRCEFWVSILYLNKPTQWMFFSKEHKNPTCSLHVWNNSSSWSLVWKTRCHQSCYHLARWWPIEVHKEFYEETNRMKGISLDLRDTPASHERFWCNALHRWEHLH